MNLDQIKAAIPMDKIKSTLTAISDKFLVYWFVISTVVIGILYILYERRGIKLEQAVYAAQEAVINEKLAQINEQAKGSQEDYEKALKDYEALKRRHSDIVSKLQLSPPQK